jgi:hypothetical protein
MDVTRLDERSAVVLRPGPGDDPDDLEDAVHDEVARARPSGEARSRVRVVVLDLSGVPDAPRWLKAAGPEQPDVTLRVALGPAGFKVARLLGLQALYEWYETVEHALAGGV